MASVANKHFEELVKSGQPVGEVVAVDKFLIIVTGLQPISTHALVMFEDGSKGFVRQIMSEAVAVLHLGASSLKIGMVAVLQNQQLLCKVGQDFIGRVVSVSGMPLDGKGPLAADAVWPVFNAAPQIYEREILDTQCESGVVSLDLLFPLMRGQRIALMGDPKSGKTSLAAQLAINQKNNDTITVFVLIAKKSSEVNALVNELEVNGALQNSIIIVSTVFESVVASYLAPYVGAAISEYLWQNVDKDVLIVYDDMTTHAQVYREISLLSGSNPGRDSYPGDMFYAHSSLLERAGKLKKNHKSLTCLPIVATAGDITAYLPTNIMSITDGQWVLDLDIFRKGQRPAVNAGLSVSRVGSRGQSGKRRRTADAVMKALAAYRQAEEFSHFGSEMALATKSDMLIGQRLSRVFTQAPGESYSLQAQDLMLDIAINSEPSKVLDIVELKSNANSEAELIKSEADYDGALQRLKAKSVAEATK